MEGNQKMGKKKIEAETQGATQEATQEYSIGLPIESKVDRDVVCSILAHNAIRVYVIRRRGRNCVCFDARGMIE